MQLFIAEKPEIARIIMSAFDKNFKGTQKDGYFIIDNIAYFTFAFGHLLKLCDPDDYDKTYKEWRIEHLPFEIDLNKIRYKAINKKQLDIIKMLINDTKVSEIIHAGDADEEGQILIDEIFKYARTNKPIKRLLLHDLTPNGVKKALSSMRNNKEFYNISQAGFGRSIADWIFGLNLTRAYTTKTRSKNVISVGRVQTPILALIVNRDLENRDFKKVYYYNLVGNFSSDGINFKALLKTKEKILDNSEALLLKERLLDKSYTLNVISEDKFINQPLPYNLLDLQVECSQLFNFKPDYTLKITQNLREKHKCISYNRSDCKYLPNSIFDDRKNLLNAIKENLGFNDLIDKVDLNIKSIAFNDEEVNKSSHYAIIPTTSRFNKANMSKDELKVYELISKKFIALFYPHKKIKTTKVEIFNDEYKFIATSNKTLELGWEIVYKNEILEENDKEDNLNNNLDLSNLNNAFISPLSIDIIKKETKPRPLYTMPTLLKDLTSISKYVTDKKIKSLLKEKDKDKKGESGGIGTPATRSEVIKTLFKRGYIEEKNKKIVSTPLGEELISNLPINLKTPNLTALWWEKQEEIRSGNLKLIDFLNDVNSDLKAQIEEIRNTEFNFKYIQTKEEKNLSEFKCLKCNSFLIKRQNKKDKSYFYSCSNYPNCNESYPILKDNTPDYDKQSIKAKEEITNFKCQECNEPLVLITSKNATFFSCKNCKKTYSLNNDKTPKFIDKSHKCPKCDGYLIRRQGSKGYFWGCSNYKNGCKVILNDNNGVPQYEK